MFLVALIVLVGMKERTLFACVDNAFLMVDAFKKMPVKTMSSLCHPFPCSNLKQGSFVSRS